MKAIAVFFALFLVVSCSPPSSPPGVCERRVRQIYHADTAFNVEQRLAIGWGADALLGFTAGRVNQTLVFDLDFESTMSVIRRSREPMVLRVESWMAPVQAVDAAVSARRGKDTKVWGWQDDDPIRVFLVVDRIPPASFRYIAAHELAHAAGFRWADCDTSKEDCTHARDASSLMFAAYSGARTFSQGDLALCRASCLCP